MKMHRKRGWGWSGWGVCVCGVVGRSDLTPRVYI